MGKLLTFMLMFEWCKVVYVSDKKIFKISANENTLWTLAAMLDFKSAQKTQIWERTIQ